MRRLPLCPGRRALVLTRDDVLLGTLEPLLEDHGFEVLPASDEPRARARIAVDEPDILLVDLEALNRDLTLLKDLQVPRGSPWPPVVVVTRDLDQETIRRCFRLGVASCVRTPLDPTEVLTKLDRAVHLQNLSYPYLNREHAHVA